MNRAKSYRILITLLFFSFISLLSRSIIYLVISLTVAVIIIVLLSRDVKERQQNREELHSSNSRVISGINNTNSAPANSSLLVFPTLFIVIGALMSSYGMTGYFEVEGIYHQLGIMSEEPFILILLFIVGMFLFIYGLTISLKKWLS